MRRLLSIALLLLISLPLISPLFAQGSVAESNLPACCRHNGTHHCMMSAAQSEALQHGEHFTTIHSKCPLCPKAQTAAHHQQYSAEGRTTVFHLKLSRMPLHTRIAAWKPGATYGARHPRGPPATFL